MIELINLFTLLWLSGCLLYAIVGLSKGSQHSINFVLIIFYIFYALPIGLDLFYAKPSYNSYPAFQLVTQDEETALIYCIFVSFIPLLWFWLGTSKKTIEQQGKRNEISLVRRMLKPILIILMISPLFGWLFAPVPSVYLTYGAVPKHLLETVEENIYNELLLSLTLVSVLSVAILLLLRTRITAFSLIPYFPWIFLACWINGKRAIVVLALFLIFYVFWQKSLLKGWRLWFIGCVFVIGICLFSVWYQSFIRADFIETQSNEQRYEHLRVDLGRDDRLKTAIYAELHPETMRILEYRGQSMLFNAAIYVPRNIWPNKPWPYAVYMTSSIYMIPSTYLGWGVTTSWLDEMIANLSWFGMLIGPLVIAWICRVGDSVRNIWIRPLTVMIACLFLAVQMAVFFPLFVVWLVLIGWYLLTGKRINQSLIVEETQL